MMTTSAARREARALPGHPPFGRAKPIVGIVAVLALLFSGDLVRLHGHADSASAADCVACVVSLAPYADSRGVDRSAADLPPVVETSDAVAVHLLPRAAPRRIGGVRDPPGTVSC